MSYLTVKGDAMGGNERRLFKEQAENVVKRLGPNLLIMNIGVGPGATLHCLQAGAPQAKIVGLDINPRRLHPDAIQALSPRVELKHGDSHSLALQAEYPAPVHIVLVDGEHRRESVKQDIAGWTPKVPVGGVIMFHDYDPAQRWLDRFPEIVGVRQAIGQWKQETGWNEEWKEAGRADSAIAFVRVAGQVR